MSRPYLPEDSPSTAREPGGPVAHYIPLYVTPLFSTNHPTPATATTALYALTVAPQCLLEVGTRVHLHFLYSATFIVPESPSSRPDPMSIPLAIKGWIAGERTRSSCEVEFVVKNEQADAPIRRAFVRTRTRPGVTLSPNLGDLVTQRLLNWPSLRTETEEPARAGNALNGPKHRSSRPSRKRARAPVADDCGTEIGDESRQAVVLYPISTLR